MLRVAAPGYAAESVAVGPATRTRGRLDVILDELPATLQAVAEPGLEQTSWTLDGSFIARGPGFTDKVPAGTHTISARHPYLVPASRSLQLERGGNGALSP